MRSDKKKARLILEAGTILHGVSRGKIPEASGEVVANSSAVGYQEIITDPANAGKIIIFTSPHIGNYGAADKFNESSGCHARAIAVKSLSPFASNWQAESTLGEFLDRNGVPCIEGGDTRKAARLIHEKGEMRGLITTDNKRDKLPAGCIPPSGTSDVSVKQVSILNRRKNLLKIGVLDLGVKNSLLAQLEQNGVQIILFPFDSPAGEISGMKVGGLIISGGPEDEKRIAAAADTAGRLRGKMPLLGISSGCIALGLSLGGRARKLLSGHRGMNYPVKPPCSSKGSITAQNHRLVIDENSKLKKTDITLINLHDGTVEALESGSFAISGIQFEPNPPRRGETHAAVKKFLEHAGESGA